MRYPFQVYRQTDFTPKRVVVSRLHDAAARFRTGVKFSPRYKNRGELTLGWLAPAWHFVVVSCKQIQSHERELEWNRSGVKVAPVSCKHPLRFAYCFACSSAKQIKHAPPPSLHLHLTFHQWRSQNNVISLIFALSTKIFFQFLSSVMNPQAPLTMELTGIERNGQNHK